MNAKKWYQSKTIQIALVQAVVGVIVVVQAQYPGAGVLLLIKSFLDVLTRVLTDQPIG